MNPEVNETENTNQSTDQSEVEKPETSNDSPRINFEDYDTDDLDKTYKST